MTERTVTRAPAGLVVDLVVGVVAVVVVLGVGVLVLVVPPPPPPDAAETVTVAEACSVWPASSVAVTVTL